MRMIREFIDDKKLGLFIRLGRSLGFDKIDLQGNEEDDLASVKFTNTSVATEELSREDAELLYEHGGISGIADGCDNHIPGRE